MKPRIPEYVDVIYLDGEAVAYDSRNTNVHYLNPTSAVAYRLCDGTATTAELVADIAEAYEMPLETIDLQVRGLIRELRKRGILEAKSTPAPHVHLDERGRVRQEVPRST